MTSTAGLDEFIAVRARLFGIAYRMLGSATEADDVLQEVWLRWSEYDHSSVRAPDAFLATMTTRLSINAATTARARYETYIGPWLPEPIDTSDDPALGAERGEALEVAVLLLMEKLTPVERAAYVLREAFVYEYAAIAEIVQLKEPAVRQLVSRARKHVREARRAPVSSGEQRRLLEAFLTAAQVGDMQSLERLFAEDVVSYSDGGGRSVAARIPVVGRSRVARFIAAFSSHFWVGVTLRQAQINGQAATVLSKNGDDFAVVSLSASAEGVDQITWMMNPQKLGAISG